MGRTATGVKGIDLEKRDRVIVMVVVRRKSTLLTVTEKGMGKRSELDEYRVQHRGGRGIITLKRADKTGNIDRKSTRLNSSHSQISYAVFCLKKKKRQIVYYLQYYVLLMFYNIK